MEIRDSFSKGVDYATVNTLKLVLNENVPVVDISLPSRAEAQGTINTAFTSNPQLGDHAWLMADVLGGSGVVEREGEIITTSTVPAIAIGAEVYTDCDGADSGATATISCDPGIRIGPMYIAYFGSDAEASVSVTSVTQTAPLRVDEITWLVFIPEPTGP